MRRRIITSLILTVVMLFLITAVSMADEVKVGAKSAILIDAKTGAILYEKDADTKRAPASMTKMMTAILVVENLKLDDEITISKHVTSIGGSAIGLKYKEKIKVKDVLSTMLVYSANDCAVALAEAVGGSEAEFAKMMTQRAKELGCTNTVFKNPSGLDDDGHMSTARDMAIIAREAVSHKEIADIVCKTQYQMAKTNKREPVTVGSTDRLLFDNYSWIEVNGKSRHPYYQYACGIKTGYTEKAGGCLASLAKKDGKEIISIVMNSTDMNRFGCAITLLDYGFDNFNEKSIAEKDKVFQTVKVKGGKAKTVDLVPTEDYEMLVGYSKEHIPDVKSAIDEARAPIAKGDKLGTVTVSLNGTVLEKLDLVAAADVEQSLLGFITSHILWVVLGAILIVVFLSIICKKKKRT